jgi:hypothetical protein
LADILLVVDDLFFLAKIQATAKLTGVPVEGVPISTLQDSLAKGPSEGPSQDPPQRSIRGVIIDLNHRSGSALNLIRGLKSSPVTAAIPVVGFLSHVQGDLAEAARAAGCDIVLARSAFAQQLPDLLRKLAEVGTAKARGTEA